MKWHFIVSTHTHTYMTASPLCTDAHNHTHYTHHALKHTHTLTHTHAHVHTHYTTHTHTLHTDSLMVFTVSIIMTSG